MSANSNKIPDIGLWIEKVIESCVTPLHEEGARHLIINFEHMLLKRNLDDDYVYYTRRLRNKLDEKITKL